MQQSSRRRNFDRQKYSISYEFCVEIRKMNCTLEVLKDDDDKYIILAIKVEERMITYFDGQITPHQTYRWMSAENWAAFDKKVKKLFRKKKLNKLKTILNYNLANGVRLQLNNSKVSRVPICELLAENLCPENIINIIECKITWGNECANGYESSPTNMLEYDPIDSNLNDIASSLETSLPISQDNDELLINETNNSLFSNEKHKNERKHKIRSSSPCKTPTSTEVSGILEQPTSISKRLRSKDSNKIQNEKCLHADYPSSQNDVSIKSTTSPLNEISSDCSDIFRNSGTSSKITPIKRKLNDNDKHVEIIITSSDTTETPKKKHNKTKKISSTDNNGSPSFPKETSPLTNLNENNNNSENLDLFAQPPEKRRRKLNYENKNTVDDDHESKGKDKNTKRVHSIEENLESLPKSNRRNVDECKTPISKSTHSKHKESTAKKKKSNRETSEKSRHQEKQTMNEWLSKKATQSDEKLKKPKDKVKQTLTSKYKSAFTSIDTNTAERKLSNVEIDIESIEQTEAKVKADRKMMENLKVLFPDKPKEVKILDLLKVSWQDILASFEDCEVDLELIFRTHKSQTKFRGIDGVDHFLVINLVSNQTEQKMMAKLADIYEKNNDYGPRYGELFSMVMMPEWILRIFMSKFNMNREAAINHLKAQNAYKDFHSISDEQLEKMSKKKK